MLDLLAYVGKLKNIMFKSKMIYVETPDKKDTDKSTFFNAACTSKEYKKSRYCLLQTPLSHDIKITVGKLAILMLGLILLFLLITTINKGFEGHEKGVLHNQSTNKTTYYQHLFNYFQTINSKMNPEVGHNINRKQESLEELEGSGTSKTSNDTIKLGTILNQKTKKSDENTTHKNIIIINDIFPNIPKARKKDYSENKNRNIEMLLRKDAELKNAFKNKNISQKNSFYKNKHLFQNTQVNDRQNVRSKSFMNTNTKTLSNKNIENRKIIFEEKLNARFKRNLNRQTYTNNNNLTTNNDINNNNDNNKLNENENNNDNEDDEEDEDGSGYDSEKERSSCCGIKEVVKQSRLEGIKSDILNQLRLSEPPNITVIDETFVETIITNNEDFNTYTTQQSSNEDLQRDVMKADDDLAATSRAFFFCEDLPQRTKSNSQLYFYCFFKITEILKHHEIKNATMGIFIEKLSLHPSPTPINNLYQESVLIESLTPNDSLNFVTEKRIEWKGNESGLWFEYNISSRVIEWQQSSESNHGLKVNIVLPAYTNNTDFSFISPKSLEQLQRRPYLDMGLVEKPKTREETRIRRSLDDEEEDDICNEDQPNTACCRYPLMVNFTELQWDFIRRPRQYQAYYCAGSCNPAYQQSFVHSHVLDQVLNSFTTDPKTTSLCCAPRSFAPLQIMYVDENNVVLSEKISSMVVKRCGCF